MGEGGQQMTALVVEANNPIDNRVKAGKQSLGALRILIVGSPIRSSPGDGAEPGPGPLRWPVPAGVGAAEWHDRPRPTPRDSRRCLWDAVPGIEQRVAANDPTLADPLGTRKKDDGGAATPRASRASHLLRLPDGRRVQQDPKGVDPGDRGRRARSGGRRPAGGASPVGRAGGGVTRPERQDSCRGPDRDQRGHRPQHGRRPRNTYSRDRHEQARTRCWRSTPPGSAPYAVFEPKFEHPAGSRRRGGPARPGLMSTDPTDVEVRWKEVPLQSRKRTGRRRPPRRKTRGAWSSSLRGWRRPRPPLRRGALPSRARPRCRRFPPTSRR